jgi:hypothetical protein
MGLSQMPKMDRAKNAGIIEKIEIWNLMKNLLTIGTQKMIKI